MNLFTCFCPLYIYREVVHFSEVLNVLKLEGKQLIGWELEQCPL